MPSTAASRADVRDSEVQRMPSETCRRHSGAPPRAGRQSIRRSSSSRLRRQRRARGREPGYIPARTRHAVAQPGRDRIDRDRKDASGCSSVAATRTSAVAALAPINTSGLVATSSAAPPPAAGRDRRPPRAVRFRRCCVPRHSRSAPVRRRSARLFAATAAADRPRMPTRATRGCARAGTRLATVPAPSEARPVNSARQLRICPSPKVQLPTPRPSIRATRA